MMIACTVCAICLQLEDRTWESLVEAGLIKDQIRYPEATCFLANQREWDSDEIELMPVCNYHKGECVDTVVPLEDGMEDYLVQEVMWT